MSPSWMGGFALATNYALPAGTATFLVENSPEGICFDGTNIWVANYGDQTITKLDEYSGRTLGTYAVAGGPGDICYGSRLIMDSPSICHANYSSQC